MRRRPARSLLAGCALALALLAAGCSASTPTLKSSAAPVTGNGRHYAYDAGSVDKSQWPDPCSLLPAQSAANALGTTLSTKRFHTNCLYTPDSPSYPTMTLTLLAVGDSLAGRYESQVSRTGGDHPHRLAGIGESASYYRVSGTSERKLDVLAGQALFELTLHYPTDDSPAARHTRTLMVGVAKVVAREFSG